MNQQGTPVIESATQIIEQGFRLPALGAGKRVTIYISPIDAAAPLTVFAARRLLYAKALTALLTGMDYQVRYHSLFADFEKPVKTLTVSIWLRYLELCGEHITYPEDGFLGDYIFDFAATVHRTYSNLWHVSAKDVAELVSQAHSCADMFPTILDWLGEEALVTIQYIGLQGISRDLSGDLKAIDVDFAQWPQASALLRDGTVTDVINRLKENKLVYSDGCCSYIKLPLKDDAPHTGTNAQLLENESGPTPLAVQLSHCLSVFGREDVCSDLNICIYDIEEAERMKLINHCMRTLACPVATVIEKPISSPHLLELGEQVPLSALAENFISFREARQTIGQFNLQWLFAEQSSGESVDIELSKEINRMWFHQCSSIQPDPQIQKIKDSKQWATALNTQDASRRYQVESFLQVITEFHDIVNRAEQLLEPALLVDYYRKLCEKFLLYYNNQELAPGEAGIAKTMVLVLQRVLLLIKPIIGLTKN